MIMINKNLIAKSGSNPNEWLPLWMHLMDTAGIMKKLLFEFVSDSFATSCGLTKSTLIHSALFLAYTHDIGKATIGFQYKIGKNVPERLTALEKCGLKIPFSLDSALIKKTPHSLAGEEILRYFKVHDSLAVIAGAHHGIPMENGELRNQELTNQRNDIVGYENYFGYSDNNRSVFENIWKCIINEAILVSGLNSINDIPIVSSQAQLLLSGLLITADWIASNTNYFPLISVDDTGDEAIYPRRVDEAWEEIGFPEMWKSAKKSYNDNSFKDSFGFIPRETQRAMLDIVSASEKPGIFILEAPMGCGKTEVALASAELMAAKGKKNGLFFGLPTQATANGLFPRVKNWAEKQSADFYHSISLKHGSAALNKAFSNIQKGIPNEESDSGLIVHSWFCDSKKACLADFVVATVDQMLMSALKRRHVMLLHLGLSEKVVVIDEVHAYDAYMNQYLERALQWLGSYHTPVILLSATLPAQRRMSLIRAYLRESSSNDSFEKNESYPLLTWTDGDHIKQSSLPYTGIHRFVKVDKCNDEELIQIVTKASNSGGCVGIILNTVARVQRIYDIVRNEITENILLYHAQYIMPDRNKKERDLIEKIGKNSISDTRNGLVVIGTQVLEQSLDIDFDLLITDICPMDLLLQRIGRLHRHEREKRPCAVSKPVCYIITDEYEKTDSGSKMIYGEWLLKETLNSLPDMIVLPDDISPLVQKVYGAADESIEFGKFIKDIEIKESKARAFLLKKPKCKDIHGFLDRTIEGKSDTQAEASVRDGISSVEVLVMKRYSDGMISFIDGTAVSPDMNEEECKRIAEQRLRLPSRFSQKWNIEKTVSVLESKCMPYISEWQKSYWLKGKLVLFLDENMQTELLGYQLKYSYEKGLLCEKESDDNERY